MEKNMERENYKFKKYIAILMMILALMAGSKAWAAGSSEPVNDETKNIRQPETAHYAKLSQLDGKPAQGHETLDALTFPLSEWAPLMSWRLFKTYYAGKPLESFRRYEMPANSSKRTRAELDYLLELQRTRTPEELAWCLKIADIYYDPANINPTNPKFNQNRDNLFYLGRSLGGWYRREELPLTAELLRKVVHDSMVYMVEFKLKYARPRPYTLEPNIKVEKPLPHGSFPSGHSFNSYVNAELLVRLAPDRRAELMNAAQEFAWSRELLGVHYPSDSEASRIWASEFVEFLFDNQQFVRDFEAVKKEWAQKRPK
jgi:acid phosphatase (class A)